MTVALAVIAVAVAAGAVVSIAARDLRLALIGVAVVAVGSALLVDPLSSPLILAIRIVGALLAVALLWTVVVATHDEAAAGGRRGSRGPLDGDAGSPLGWPAEALIAAGAAFAGLGIAANITGGGFSVVGAGPTEVTVSLTAASPIAAAATASLVLGLAPAMFGRSAIRGAIGLVLIVHGAIGLRIALAGSPADLEQLVFAGLVIACASIGFASPGVEHPAADHDARPGG
ncbi:MAG TPA: hypothetical protein VEX41_08275 [Candidatus Eisenbacteria bacterium]|nr:hypothetical protein [Candidatus Eisenbacteria bacterium]